MLCAAWGVGGVQVRSLQRWGGEKYVVKHYTDKIGYDRERSALLELMRTNVLHVPTLLKSNAKGLWLVEQPVAKDFDRGVQSAHPLSPKHIASFMTTLRGAHQAGLVHRDVSLRNMFWLSAAGATLLNDWGSAFKTTEDSIGIQQDYIGVYEEASSAILTKLIDGVWPPPRPQDDLHALTRVVYIYLNAPRLPNRAIELKKYWRQLLEFWEVALQCGDWNCTHDLAESLKYDELTSTLEKFLSQVDRP